MVEHVPRKEWVMSREEFWWCNGMFHRHQTRAAAEKCEARTAPFWVRRRGLVQRLPDGSWKPVRAAEGEGRDDH